VLASRNLTAGSIKVYLSAVRQLQISSGGKDPKIADMPRLAQVLRGIKSTQASRQPASAHRRLPVTPEILRAIKVSWETKSLTYDRVMLWGAMMLCYFGFFRSGEICTHSQDSFNVASNMMFSDVSVDNLANPSCIRVFLKKSKTDQEKQGTLVYLGKTGESLYPVAALLSWLVIRGNGKGPLFQYANGTPLTQSNFTAEFRRALGRIGVDPRNYSGHSFRAGTATEAASQGVGYATIKLLGRWKSSAYQVYIKTPPASLAPLSNALIGLPSARRAH